MAPRYYPPLPAYPGTLPPAPHPGGYPGAGPLAAGYPRPGVALPGPGPLPPGYPGSWPTINGVPLPVSRPARPNQGIKAALVVLLVLAALCGLGDAVLVAVPGKVATATFGLGPQQGSTDLKALLTRRASAIEKHDETMFLADVDPSRPTFVQREKDEYANLQALDLSVFGLELGDRRYSVPDGDGDLLNTYEGGLRAIAVTVRYAVRDFDPTPVAQPWIPVFGEHNGRWLLVDEVTEGKIPEGTGGLPWETGPVVVKRGPHVVAVLSKDDQGLADQLLTLAETGVANAAAFWPTGWSGKVLVTAVSDDQVIKSYFRDGDQQLSSVAAVAVPGYDRVPDWNSGSSYVTSRVLFNPASLGGATAELQMTLTHEFVHVATGSVTSGATPLWLVEGIAEYVAITTGKLSDATLAYRLQQVGFPTALPKDGTFYDVGYPNYVYASLACRYLVSKYGKAKLVALYNYYDLHNASTDGGLSAVLGVDEATFTAGYLAYLHKL